MNSIDASRKAALATHGPEYLVIGAGLAGLSAAMTLHRAGKEVLVVERGDAVGGRVRTDFESGFVLDRGFQVLLTAYPELERHLDLSQLNLRPFIRGASVWDKTRFIELSEPRSSLSGSVNALRTRVLTPGDKIRLLRFAIKILRSNDGLISKDEDCATGKMFEQLGFSSHSVALLWEPLSSGIQLTPSLEGSARLACLILRCLMLGSAAVPADGMQAIPQQMASKLPSDAIRVRTEVENIDRTRIRMTNGDEISAPKVILATEGGAAARLLGVPQGSSRSQWHAYFSAPEPPNDRKSIHLLPADEGPCRNLAVMSNVAPEYAPKDAALIVVAGPTTESEAPLSQVQRQLTKMFGSQVESWQILKAGVVAGAQPLFAPGTPFRRKQDGPQNIVLAGDHRTTPSIQGALVSGRQAAQTAMEER